MADPAVTIDTYITGLANNFAKDTASITQLGNVVDFVNDNKYFDNLYIAGRLLFMNTFMAALPAAIIAFKTEIGDPKPSDWNGFDINKLYCALDYAIKKFPGEFEPTYYDVALNPPPKI
jgi:hypothetical protein